MPKSAFQELMELVTMDLDQRNKESLRALEKKLQDLDREFKQDHHLLEAALERVRRKIRDL